LSDAITLLAQWTHTNITPDAASFKVTVNTENHIQGKLELKICCELAFHNNITCCKYYNLDQNVTHFKQVNYFLRIKVDFRRNNFNQADPDWCFKSTQKYL